jgi:hypothetical protein
MSDRPSAINGKRNRAWGTLHACPACGQCLCFGCHPAGPCVDEQAHSDAASVAHESFAPSSYAGSSGAWLTAGPSGASGAAGLRMRTAADPAGGRLR